jgi:hypothetical protein
MRNPLHRVRRLAGKATTLFACFLGVYAFIRNLPSVAYGVSNFGLLLRPFLDPPELFFVVFR